MPEFDYNSFYKASEPPPAVVNRSRKFELSNQAAPKNIVALIPRGEVIRNFVYSGAFDFVAEQANLSLVTISPGSSTKEIFRKDYGATFPLTEYRERWLVRIQRDLLDMAHGRWLWSKAAQERWRLRDAESVTLKQKTVRAIKKAVCLPFANRAGLRTLSKIERVASRLLKTTDDYIDLYKKIKPDLVFNGSHIHSRNAIQAVQAANWLQIPTATFIFSWDNLTSQGRITLPYDYFLVWNQSLKRQLLDMYDSIKPEQVFVTGTPQFDFHFREEFHQSREQFCAAVGADPARPIVLYTTGMANHMPGEPEIVEGVADILSRIEGAEKPQLLVRIYPKDLTGRFDRLKARRTDILFPHVAWEPDWLTPKYEDCCSLVNTLRHSACGINVASTISLELCMFDKPVINVGYNPAGVDAKTLRYADYYQFDHYKPIVESGAVEVAASAEEMRELIQKALDEPPRRKTERKKLLEKMFGSTLDGKAARRVARTLLRLADKSER